MEGSFGMIINDWNDFISFNVRCNRAFLIAWSDFLHFMWPKTSGKTCIKTQDLSDIQFVDIFTIANLYNFHYEVQDIKNILLCK